ncbi:hypothetical protein [Nonomuraea sediminis]|uniref:hypothetical protein n=1 Tax=Nonomuraea sediminis TaxID=2835864 RepID=UPI001BDC9D4B|nr:hypothetical protein [Nonomuraea sediminis]
MSRPVVAITSALIAISSISALVIALSVNQADALAAAALALAILTILIEPATDYPSDAGAITLSEKGVAMGRLLTARGDAPQTGTHRGQVVTGFQCQVLLEYRTHL